MSAGRTGPLVPDPERLESVKLVGAGGVGGIVARYGVAFAAASGAEALWAVIDGDRFEPRNAERMLFSSCGNKAAVVCDDLLPFVEGTALTLLAIEEYVTPESLDRLIVPGDVVLLAVDNHATRKLVADHCAKLDDVCLISGGNDGVGEDSTGRVLRGTYGNVQIHRRREGRDESPPLTAWHPEIADPKDVSPGDLSCTEAITTVPQILFTNLATASAMLNALYLHACCALEYPEVCFDIAEGRMQPLPLPVPAAEPVPRSKAG